MNLRWRRLVATALCGGAAMLPACFSPGDGSAISTGGSSTDGTTAAGTLTAGATTESTSSVTSNPTASATATTDPATTDPATTDPATTDPATTDAETGSTDDSGDSADSGSSSSGSSSSTGGCPLVGETAADTEDPQLIAVQFTSTDEVRLTFSEPMADPVDVRPDQFRLSAAESIYAPGPNPTYYNDLGFLDGIAIEVEEIVFDPCVPEEFLLQLSDQITQELCDTVDSWAGGYTDGAIFVHYSRDVPNGDLVEDLSGNDLADISPDWVLEPGNQHTVGAYGGHFPYMDPDLPIPCPGF